MPEPAALNQERTFGRLLTMTSHVPVRLIALCALLLVAGCGGTAADSNTMAFQLQLQQVDRYARAERPEPRRLVVTMQDYARVPSSRATIDPMARRIAERAFAGGFAQTGDTLIVEYHRGRRLGPFAFGAAVTRFTYFGPPTASDRVRSAIPR